MFAYLLLRAFFWGFCVPLTNNDGVVYTTFVGVGTPPQHIAVVPDTGSYVLVSASTYCRSESCRLHRRFDPNSSSTCSNVSSHEFLLEYGQGDIIVHDSTESVSFLGTEASTTPIHEGEMVSLALISEEALKGFQASPFDGIMGMGKGKTTELGDDAFLEDLKIESFTLCMGDTKLTGDGIGGRLEMQSQLAVGNEYKPLATIGEHVWGTVLAHVGVPGQTASMVCSDEEACAAIIDSGTTLLMFPTSVVDSLYSSIEAGCTERNCLLALQEQATCSGSAYNGLPNLELKVGGQTLLLPPRVYMGEMEVDIPTFHLAIKDGPIEASIRQHYELGIRCVPLLSALDAMTTSGPMAILGIPFLREYAVYFDRASWGMSVAQIEEGSSVCSQCGTTFASRLIEHISGSSETALAAGSSALQPEAITATMSSNNVRRAAPIKVSRVRGPSLHGVPTVIMPNMLDDAHRHEVPAWTHHNRTRRVWVL